MKFFPHSDTEVPRYGVRVSPTKFRFMKTGSLTFSFREPVIFYFSEK